MNKHIKRSVSLFLAAALALLPAGCGRTAQATRPDPKNPVTISVWHYYNGAILNAFEALVSNFNETVGMDEGIIIEHHAYGTVTELEKAVVASANKEIGSQAMPNIFASYADTAYEAEKMGLLANLDDYFTEKEQQEYFDSYIEEGKIGLNGELRIFPVAKSMEILMLNDIDWIPFAEENGLTYDDLATVEGITRVARLYYHWTDSLTPDVPDDGKSFYGRDSMANFFIIASKEFGTEIFQVENGVVTLNINRDVMRKIWDNYYVPHISGYFSSHGKYRSEDTKVGDILAYVGSTSSVAYFPSEITRHGEVWPIQAKVLPTPHFEGGERVMVQQGAGMVVTESTPQEEYASVVFLKWFTQAQNNIEFAALSGYMPVKKEAIVYDTFQKQITAAGWTLDDITSETLRVAFEETATSELYTNKAFGGGVEARAILEYDLKDKADADRNAVLELMKNGETHEQAVAQLNTEENFNHWLEAFTARLNEAVS